MTHNHSHHHQHSHASIKNIRLAFFLNFGFTIIEIIGGIITNSTAILADAVHDLGDTIALGQAWYFEKLSVRQNDNRYTYGFRRFSLLGALFSTILILISSLYILSEAIPRLINPEPSNASGMILLAVFGIAVNGYAMFRLMGDSEKSINIKAVGLHLLEDVLGWIAILIVAVVLLFKDVYILDPILAILITIYILANVARNLRKILPIFLQAAPDEIDVEKLKREIKSIEYIKDLHDIHIWSLDDQNQVFTVHLNVDKNLSSDQYAALKQNVKFVIQKHGFTQSTVEIELPEETCRIETH